MIPAEEQSSQSGSVLAVATGADQVGLRLYNERLILSLVRRYRQLSKIEVARLTGLSVQTASATMNRLQLDGLLRREAPQRWNIEVGFFDVHVLGRGNPRSDCRP